MTAPHAADTALTARDGWLTGYDPAHPIAPWCDCPDCLAAYAEQVTEGQAARAEADAALDRLFAPE